MHTPDNFGLGDRREAALRGRDVFPPDQLYAPAHDNHLDDTDATTSDYDSLAYVPALIACIIGAFVFGHSDKYHRSEKIGLALLGVSVGVALIVYIVLHYKNASVPTNSDDLELNEHDSPDFNDGA